MSLPPGKRISSPTDDNPRPSVRHKRGKRIVQLLEQQQKSLQQNQLHHGHKQSTHRASASQPNARPTGQPGLTSTRSYTAPILLPHTEQCGRASLLEVAGLTRETLDDCINAYFSYVEPAYRLSQSRDQFFSRVRVLMYEIAGADVPNDLSNVLAASELLVLAVACLGAPLSAHPQIAQAIFDRCRSLAEEPEYLEASVLDTIEAVNLLESAARPPQLPGRGEKTSHLSNPLKLDPLGQGYAVDLALYHRLNLCPLVGDIDPEYDRRQTLFWILWELDAIRMVSARTPCRLSDVNIGWADPSDPQPHARLATIARQISSAALSVRAKAHGIREADLSSAITKLDNFDSFVDQMGGLQTLPPGELFLQSVRNLLYLVCWAAARDSGLSTEFNVLLNAAAREASGRMTLLAEHVTTHGQLNKAPQAVRDHFAAFILFIVRRLSEEQGTTSTSDAAQYLGQAEALGRAVRSATVYRDSERLAHVLRDTVYIASQSARSISPDSPDKRRQDVHSSGPTPASQSLSSGSRTTIQQNAADVKSDSARSQTLPLGHDNSHQQLLESDRWWTPSHLTGGGMNSVSPPTSAVLYTSQQAEDDMADTASATSAPANRPIPQQRAWFDLNAPAYSTFSESPAPDILLDDRGLAAFLASWGIDQPVLGFT